MATTHGLYYAFERGVLPISNIFWVATCVALFTLALVLTISAYVNWRVRLLCKVFDLKILTFNLIGRSYLDDR